MFYRDNNAKKTKGGILTKAYKALAVGAICLSAVSSFGTGIGECSLSIQEQQKQLMSQMRENNRNFGKQDKSEFEATKREMKKDSTNRQHDIENRKKNMEDGYSAASVAYGSTPNTSPLQAPTQKELGQNPAMERYKLPEQVDETAKVRKGQIVDDEASAETPESAYIDEGEGAKQEAKQSKKTVKSKVKQLGLVSGFLFVVMAGLVYINRRRKAKNS